MSNEYYVYAHYIPGNSTPFYIGKGKHDRLTSREHRNASWEKIVADHGFEAKILMGELDEDSALLEERNLILSHGIVGKDENGILINEIKPRRSDIKSTYSEKYTSVTMSQEVANLARSWCVNNGSNLKLTTELLWLAHLGIDRHEISKFSTNYESAPNSKYTTIQIKSDRIVPIRRWCKENGKVISAVTENMWDELISASMHTSGSQGTFV